MKDSIKICGVNYKIESVSDEYGGVGALNLGQIDYVHARIILNPDMADEVKKEVLTHEIVHGMLHHIGYDELNQDETFVQAFANALYQTVYESEG